MARPAANDPLEKFRFLVDFEGIGRAGFHDVQMPKRTTTKGTYREGTDKDINQLFAGLSTMEDIVMSRGMVSMDAAHASDFYKWVALVHAPSSGNDRPNARPAGSASNDYKKEVTIKMLNRDGTLARVWKLYNAFPVNYVPGSDLNAGEDGEKSMETLTLAYEDFQELSPADSTSAKNTTLPQA